MQQDAESEDDEMKDDAGVIDDYMLRLRVGLELFRIGDSRRTARQRHHD